MCISVKVFNCSFGERFTRAVAVHVNTSYAALKRAPANRTKTRHGVAKLTYAKNWVASLYAASHQTSKQRSSFEPRAFDGNKIRKPLVLIIDLAKLVLWKVLTVNNNFTNN